MNGKIYIINNIKTKKSYIGQTIQDVSKRFKQHLKLSKSSSKQLIYKSILKYGKENFKCEILKDNIDNYSDLNYWEEYFIKEKNTLSPQGYNLCPGGQKYRRKPIINESQKNYIIKMYLDGNSTRYIGNKIGHGHGTILRVLRENNIELRKKNYKLPDRTSKINKEILSDLYNKNLSNLKIAKILNVNEKTIRRAIKRFNLNRKQNPRVPDTI